MYYPIETTKMTNKQIIKNQITQVVDVNDLYICMDKARADERKKVLLHLRKNKICPCKAGLATYMGDICGHAEFSKGAVKKAKAQKRFKNKND
jgi:hypothetical protein